jgi:uncharacterized protein YrrD
MNEARRIAWSALPKGTTVTTSDGEDIGKVAEVIADEQKDIFSGITFRHGLLDSEHFVPADQVEQMTTDRVSLSIDSEAVKNLGPYEG